MKETTPPPSADPVADPRTVLSPSERLFARMTLAQTVTAVVAVLISCAAMYATWQQAQSARTQTEAQVWPRIVSFTNLTVSDNGEPVFEVVMANRGIGPAEVRSMRVFRDETYFRRYSEIIAALPDFGREVRVRQGYVNRRIFAPGEEAVIIGAQGQDVIDALNTVIEGFEVELCYCSILSQCWLMLGDDTMPTAECPDHGENEFRN